ncbi:MAG: hypothetical protein KF752_03365 [Pirellulaceae bacterium]|nr:hypothetical protein [Pirellulaceae bacterium]
MGKSWGSLARQPGFRQRKAFTLLELMLSLSLIVVATALIGSVMSLYARSFSTRGQEVRNKQLARSILQMIADDIRAVVVQQPVSPSILTHMYESVPGSAAVLSASGSMAEQTDAASNSTGSQSAGAGQSVDLTMAMPPGIYGNQNELSLDVSRIPRADEYLQPMASLITLTDRAADIKRVSYFVQAATALGVQDSMLQVSSGVGMGATGGSNGGLIRRQLDRAITSFATSKGFTNQLMTTGDLIAPEVVAVQFSYFDGTQWTMQWDSALQGLPRLVQITLGITTISEGQPPLVQPGISLMGISRAELQQARVEIYELVVAIPGAQLQTGAGQMGVSATDNAVSGEALGL